MTNGKPLSALTGDTIDELPKIARRGRTRAFNPFDDEVKASYETGKGRRYSLTQLRQAGIDNMETAVNKLRSAAAYLNVGLKVVADDHTLHFQAVEKRKYVLADEKHGQSVAN